LSKLRNLFNDVVEAVPECLAAGLVDIASGLMLDVETAGPMPSRALDMIAATTMEMFCGKNVIAIQDMVQRGDGDYLFDEITLANQNFLHVFLRMKMYGNFVLCLVFRRSVHLGMALTAARDAVTEVEQVI
jgi:hypothetical protein